MSDMMQVDEQPTWDGMTPRQMQVEIERLRKENSVKDKVLLDALWEQIGRLLVERNTLRQLLIEERERNVRLREREQEEQMKLREETGREHH